ncbi:MAG: OprO/OprP family phosphate-selective porin [Candidatus Binatia bacterium]
MAAERWVLAAGLVCILSASQPSAVRAEEKRVVDELLDILRANKQISEQQYRSLKQKAEQERQEDLRKAKEEPSPEPTVAVAAVPTPAPSAAPDTMRAYFKNGYNLETADGNFKLNIGAKTQLDWNVSDPGIGVKRMFGLQGTYTGVEFRRARIALAGTVYKNVDYKFEYDFADGSPAFKDVYMGVKGLPIVQYVRVGHFKEPFSLEEITSDDFTTFMERSLPNAFAPSRNTGIAAMPVFFEEHMTVTAGAFRETNNSGYGYGNDQEYNVTARITGVPVYRDEGRNLIHLGLSYSHKFRHMENISFAQRPESHLFPVNLVNTQSIETDGVDLINPEIAFVRGPLSVQAEYMNALVQQVDASNPDFGSFYVYASYFLTGEQRPYRLATGAFDRIMPRSNFTSDLKHWGAWELAARFSRLDLDSEDIDGGTLDDITAGVNWYLNPNMRITVNYVWAHLESVGDSNIAQGRFQLAF